ncbi:amino acid permease/ SLC12A domain-containing protein [Phycomyces blakesleeanus]|uniref:Amino acid permease/ SLC12A domain-containing protein n=1 Tax=Phycomyces blakesleeanus TaxID=4837 RepID=A0ABR3AMF7_PHYBL
MINEKLNRLEEGSKRPSYTNEKTDSYSGPIDPSFTSGRDDSVVEFEPLKRGLDARHIQMISLGGAIGTGLFLNSGQNIAAAGPAGALIAYCVVGFMVFCIMTCLGEMATFLPVSGSFNHYASRFVDPALGFALGWNYWFSWGVTIATELSASATIINWWKPIMPDAAWSVIFLVMIVAINLVGVRVYGELEYWFALLKILIVFVFVIIAICVTSGGLGDKVIGFSYWKDPGAFVDGGVGTISVLLSAGFSFLGTEIVGVTAAEAKNPSKTVPKAIRNTFWRIIFFYIVTIFLLGLCIPNNDPNLINDADDPATASFTLVFILGGIDAGAHVINAIVLSSVLSAANSSLYTCARTLMALARDGHAPLFLARTNRYGAPHYAVFISSIIGFACVFASIYSASAAFLWFLSITAVTGFIGWCGISFVQLRFRMAYVKQGRDIADLPYRCWLYPFSPIFSGVLCLLIILGQGYTAFTPKFDGTQFVINYIGILPVIFCYVIYKFIRKTKVVPLDEVDFDTGRVDRTEEDDEEEQKEGAKPWYLKIMHFFA